jgi:hypothetical protein
VSFGANCKISGLSHTKRKQLEPFQLTRHQSTSPGISKVPIFLTKHWKVLVLGRRVGNITNVEENSIVVFPGPFGTMFRDNSSGIDVVPIVEVVIVVPVSKVLSRSVINRERMQD